MLKEKFAPENGNGKVENVFRASDSHLAVVSGGVVLGLDPSLIRTRRANQSYGIEVEEVFDESIHEVSRLTCRDGTFLCTKVFFPFVETGQEIDTNNVVERNFDITGGTTRITIYTSPKKKVKYVDEEGVYKLGDLEVTSPITATSSPGASSSSASSSSSSSSSSAPLSPPIEPIIIVRFQFGKIEFHVEAKDYMGKKCENNFMFASSL